jgi:hypothetical protein
VFFTGNGHEPYERNEVMHVKRILFLTGVGVSLALSGGFADETPSVVEIRQTEQGFQLIRNGEPYFITGAGGTRKLDILAASGGNSVRTWSSSRKALDRAHEQGLSVCMGIRMQKPRQGADYRDAAMLEKQRERIREEVVKLKDHPALLMWGVGNEVEHHASREDCILVWKEIEFLAAMIKEIDPNHPVITVTAGAGAKLEDIRKLCPSLDALGINSYGKLPTIPGDVERYNWDRPYIITEFGPRGWWEVEQTAWGLPIEDTSTEKALVYYNNYKAAIDNRPNCLGSYVFLWGNKQEKTHTWFNLFLEDGSSTEMVDTMTKLWTGKWPDNRAPAIGERKIYSTEDDVARIYEPGAEVRFAVEAQDPDGDAITVEWDIRPDESDNPGIGGDWEQRIAPVDEAIRSSESDSVVVRMPDANGNYRLFVYVRDPSGKVATANLPVRVESGE